MAKIVLLSSLPLPYHQIGSWDKRYTYLINQKDNPFDYIICPKINDKLIKSKNIKYLHAERLKYESLTKKIFKYSFINILSQLKKILKVETKLVIYIVDNVRLAEETHAFLESNKMRQFCRVVFNICGLSYFFIPTRGVSFYNKIEHIIFTSYGAYHFEIDRYPFIASKVSIIYNGIDSGKFYKVNDHEKKQLKKKIGYETKKICLWLSQERPKKGLHILIEAWKKSNLYKNEDFVLMVIGYSIVKKEDNIHYLGEILNDDLAKYYQSADYYFFTTLGHEGFGLSLAEAIKCGTTCFSSNILPLKEITQNGSLAYLTDNPHIPDSWTFILNQIFEDKVQLICSSKEELDKVYDLDDWCTNLKRILSIERQLEF